MKTLRHLTLFFSAASLLFLLIFPQQTLTLNLYVAFTLLFATLQGVAGLLAPPEKTEGVKIFLMDWEINLSFRLIRIGLYGALVCGFILHDVRADSAAQITLALSFFNGWAVLFALALLLYFTLFYHRLLARTEAFDPDAKGYALTLYRYEMGAGALLYLLSLGLALWVGSLLSALPYLTAVLILWIAPTLLGAFGRAMILAKNPSKT